MNQRLYEHPQITRGLAWLYGKPLPHTSPEAAHRLRLLLISSAVIGVSSLIVLVIQLLAFVDPWRESPPSTDIVMGTVLLLVSIIALHWTRRDRLTAAARVLTASLLTYTLIQFYEDGDPTQNLSAAQTALLTIILAHILLGSRAGWVLFGLTTLALIGLDTLWHLDYLPPAPAHGDRSRAIYAITVWTVGGGLIVLIANSTLNVLRRQTATLEAVVTARTADLSASERRFRALFEHSPDAFLLIDPRTWAIVDCNEAACRMNGYTREELIGESITMLTPSDKRGGREIKLERLRSGGLLRYDTVHVRKDGSRFPIEVSNSLVEIDGRELVLGIDRDITHQKQAEHALRQTLAAELEMNHLRARVLSMASHDLRNPLAAIQMTCELLQRHGQQLTDEQREVQHERVYSTIMRMLRLLDDMLALAHAASSDSSPEAERIDLPQFCRELIDEFRQAGEHTQTVTMQTEGTSRAVQVYRSPLHHVVVNILGNALKYSPPDSTVTITLRYTPAHVELAVADQGIGIPAEVQAQLFEPFFRAENAQDVQGSGLGLSIVKQSLALLGGTITIDSVEHEGTTVTVTLPYTPPVTPP